MWKPRVEAFDAAWGRWRSPRPPSFNCWRIETIPARLDWRSVEWRAPGARSSIVWLVLMNKSDWSCCPDFPQRCQIFIQIQMLNQSQSKRLAPMNQGAARSSTVSLPVSTAVSLISATDFGCFPPVFRGRRSSAVSRSMQTIATEHDALFNCFNSPAGQFLFSSFLIFSFPSSSRLVTRSISINCNQFQSIAIKSNQIRSMVQMWSTRGGLMRRALLFCFFAPPSEFADWHSNRLD